MKSELVRSLAAYMAQNILDYLISGLPPPKLEAFEAWGQ